jgi:hypothetical protein
LRVSAWLAFLPSGSGNLARLDGRQSKPSGAGPRSARARPLPATRQAGRRRIAAPPDTRACEATTGSEMRFARHCAFAFTSLCTPASSDFRRHLTFELSGALPTAKPAVRCPLERGVGRQAQVLSSTFRQRALSLLDLRALCQPCARQATMHL